MITRRGLIKYGLLDATTAMIQKPVEGRAAAPGYGISGRVAPELQVDYWIDRDDVDSRFQLADQPVSSRN